MIATLSAEREQQSLHISASSAKINLPIERNGAKGQPAEIALFEGAINARQERILSQLPEYNSKIIVPKKSVGLSDLAALTAKTNVEFAMFTKGNERLLIRGDSVSVNVTLEYAEELAKAGYRWSGHTHPGMGASCRIASDGDKAVLAKFKHRESVIYDSSGSFTRFGADEDGIL